MLSGKPEMTNFWCTSNLAMWRPVFRKMPPVAHLWHARIHPTVASLANRFPLIQIHHPHHKIKLQNHFQLVVSGPQ